MFLNEQSREIFMVKLQSPRGGSGKVDVLNHPEALVEMTLGSQVHSHVRRALAQKLRSQLALVKGACWGAC